MKTKLSIPLGTSDIYGNEGAEREQALSIIREVYESFGFEPLHTPAFEHENVFEGHHGEGEAIQFRFTDKQKKPLVLRYDLTVPMIRFLAMHSEIPRPFKRYQIASSFRDDSVDHGHHREFIQCDADTVGVNDPTSDAEVVIMAACGLTKLGFDDFRIRVNHRGIITALAKYACGHSDNVNRVSRVIDCADKYIRLGIDGIKAELMKRGLSYSEADKLSAVIAYSGTVEQTFEFLAKHIGSDTYARRSIAELKCINGYIPKGIRKHIVIDLSLARGADYYTGFILEGIIPGVPVGAVLGGGRYDNLMEKFGDRSEPAVGMAFGLERILTARKMLSIQIDHAHTSVLVYPTSKKATNDALGVAHGLRVEGEYVNYCSRPLTAAEAVEYAKYRHHSVIVACNRDKKHSITCLGSESQETMNRYLRLLHCVQG